MNKMVEIEFESFGIEPESAVAALESRIGVTIPQQLRRHLLNNGGGYIADCVVKCKFPTPFGRHNVCEFASVDIMISMIDSDIIPRNLLYFGAGHLGKWTCVSISGIDHGKIYSFDSEMRYYWTQEEIDARPSLDHSIIEFFHLRDGDGLPVRPWGYENCYEIADSLDEFLDMLTIVS
ncbi:SMI1/KNR4 family protein [Blastopirellula sp. J2-11]|uniref:SMI1/KNR4 family protein n=1 Tax=Blastopirellula sp. J2-11 TaxID=2943192 RepID=UPI0021C7CF2A|nr:SMI1/KNR4 family protein [Blastopirellula sp. J2-11]UUO06182.1 SMI1/KNR4 family protein [Blastopirellula sp. J2-11]